jgi:selenocysteine-specific elongation factor
MSKGELNSKFPPVMSDKLFNHLLNAMIKSKGIVVSDNSIRLSTHTVTLKADQSDIKKKIIDTYLSTRLQPPYFKELSEALKIDPIESKNVLMLLVKEGSMIKVKEELFFHADVITDLKNRLTDFLKSNREISTPQFKEMTGASRKYTIPLLEYFDAENLTIRVGDIRQLRKQ